jgi:carboxypeptidase family protein
MCLRHRLIIGALGSTLAACGLLPFGPSNNSHLDGWVHDTLSRPVPGTRIDILDGPQAGASATADQRGAFEFVSSASGAVRLRASRDGFEPATITAEWQPSIRLQTIDFVLRALEPPLPITPGSYTLTVTTDRSTATDNNGGSCADFPADLLKRSYEALISNWSPAADKNDFLVELASPTLTKPPGATCRLSAASPVVRGCFTFRVAGQFVGFELQNSWGWDWIEEWPGFRYLMIEGTAPTSDPATLTDTSVTIPFWGTFEYCQLKSGLGQNSSCHQMPAEQRIEYRWCSSKQDTMVFTKR